MKKPTFAPAYVGLYPILSEVANSHGYALAVHGSCVRDFDLIAIPWIQDASLPNVLAAAIVARIQQAGVYDSMRKLTEPTAKPHGRMAWLIPIDCGAVIDLGVMPIRRLVDSDAQPQEKPE